MFKCIRIIEYQGTYAFKVYFPRVLDFIAYVSDLLTPLGS